MFNKCSLNPSGTLPIRQRRHQQNPKNVIFCCPSFRKDVTPLISVPPGALRHDPMRGYERRVCAEALTWEGMSRQPHSQSVARFLRKLGYSRGGTLFLPLLYKWEEDLAVAG